MIKLLELISFAVSVLAFGYAGLQFFHKESPKYFQLYACAAGCYMLEELWVIVNSLLGNGLESGLLTVRLFGFFGCLCFMLSANVNEFDRVVDEGKNKKAVIPALAFPLLLLLFFSLYAFSPLNTEPDSVTVFGLISLSPALAAAYFSAKHLFLPEDALGLLRITRKIDILALIFYGENFLYPFVNLYLSGRALSVCDLILTGTLFALILSCGKGARQWKALI